MELFRLENETIKVKKRRNPLDKEIYNLRKTELVRPWKLLSAFTPDTEYSLPTLNIKLKLEHMAEVYENW